MNEEQIWELMVKKHHRTISTHESEMLDNWIDQNPTNRQLAESMNLVLSETNLDHPPVNYNAKKAWIKVERRIVSDSAVKYLTPTVFRWAAAAVLILGLTGIAYWQLKTTPVATEKIAVSTQARESKQLMLPDGTRVWMNENSSISYPADFNADSVRVVQLSGEAFFEVTHNPARPFIVAGAGYNTRVLGTSFNVRLTEHESSVMVVTGKVRFSYGKSRSANASVVIQKGYQAIANQHHELVMSPVINTNKLAWRTGILEFKNEKIADVINELSSYYRVPIQLKIDKPHQYLFTGTLEQVSAATALETVCYSLHLRWKKTPQGYLISNL
ncbi:MAG: FecR family protein [Cytophagales bacterium]